MVALIFFLLNLGASLFKPKSWLEAENAALRQQLIVLQRQVRGRAQFTNGDRLFFIQLYRWFPSVLKAMTIMRPETVMRWQRAGFRRYWRWKSRNLGGRPKIAADLRALIRQMSTENWLWGAPRIHGELLKLGFVVASRRWPSSGQQWWPARSELGHVPAQSYATHCSHGSVRGPDHQVRPALCIGHCPIGPTRACVDQRDCPLNGRMHCAANTEAFPWHEAPRYLSLLKI